MFPVLPLLAATIATATPTAVRPAAEVSLAQLIIAPPAPPPLPLPDQATLAIGASHERMTVPVQIGRRGPWDFIIDTGAERTVVSRELAGVLGLSAGPSVNVVAMTGAERVGSVVVPELSVSYVSRGLIHAPALEARDLGAVGLLGIDALQDHAIEIDFDRRQMTVRPSKKRGVKRYAALPGEVVVSAKSQFGQLIVTDAFWNGKRIAVVIDTGSPLTIGNQALLAAITRRPKRLGRMEMTSVIGGLLSTDAYLVDGLEIGAVGFQNVRVAFADVLPFARFGLADTPALMLGMDALKLFRRVRIDFANREIRFGLPRSFGDASINSLSGFSF